MINPFGAKSGPLTLHPPSTQRTTHTSHIRIGSTSIHVKCELGLCYGSPAANPTTKPTKPPPRHSSREVRPQPFAPTSVSWGADLIFFFTVKHNGEFVAAPRSTMPIYCHNRTLRWLCCMLPSVPRIKIPAEFRPKFRISVKFRPF